MEFPAHIVFSCLLVCQPAIFVDSKRDGTGAAHGRKGFRMKRAEFDGDYSLFEDACTDARIFGHGIG